MISIIIEQSQTGRTERQETERQGVYESRNGI